MLERVLLQHNTAARLFYITTGDTALPMLVQSLVFNLTVVNHAPDKIRVTV